MCCMSILFPAVRPGHSHAFITSVKNDYNKFFCFVFLKKRSLLKDSWLKRKNVGVCLRQVTP